MTNPTQRTSRILRCIWVPKSPAVEWLEGVAKVAREMNLESLRERGEANNLPASDK